MNVCFTYLSTIPLNPWEKAFLPIVQEHFARHPDGPYRLVDTPEEAEIIVALESNSFRTHRDIDALLQEPLLRDFPEKVFTVNYEDFPAGFLPGLYAALPADRLDPRRHLAWCYLFPGEPRSHLTRPIPRVEDAALLFSFRGAESSELRARFFRMEWPSDCRGRCTKINRWFDHTAEEQSAYFDEIGDSKFVLCPYGQGIASRRLFEVMELGRCPVIFGGGWVPPSEIDWSQCSIQLTDADVERLPEILASREGDAPELGRRAKEAWERYFSPARKFDASLDALVRMRDSRSPGYSEREQQNFWRSRAFYRRNGWTLEQRLGRKVRQWWQRLRPHKNSG